MLLVGSIEEQIAPIEFVFGKLFGRDIGALHLAAIDHTPLHDLVHAEDLVADAGFVHLFVQTVLNVKRQYVDGLLPVGIYEHLANDPLDVAARVGCPCFRVT